jgi:hypothetical protein
LLSYYEEEERINKTTNLKKEVDEPLELASRQQRTISSLTLALDAEVSRDSGKRLFLFNGCNFGRLIHDFGVRVLGRREKAEHAQHPHHPDHSRANHKACELQGMGRQRVAKRRDRWVAQIYSK